MQSLKHLGRKIQALLVNGTFRENRGLSLHGSNSLL